MRRGFITFLVEEHGFSREDLEMSPDRVIIKFICNILNI